MVNTANQADYKKGFEISNHSFLNAIMAGLQKNISSISRDLELVPSGKSVNGRRITLRLSGQIIAKDENELGNIDTGVRQFIDSIRNPANFISLIDK